METRVIKGFNDLIQCVDQLAGTLPSEGYMLMVSYTDKQSNFIIRRWRHMRNGNVITIKAQFNKIQQWKNNKLTRQINIKPFDASI